jgi:hypothetical protein
VAATILSPVASRTSDSRHALHVAEPSNPFMKQMEKYLTVAGFTLFVAFVGSCMVLTTAPTDSGQRGFGHGALGASGLLECAWMLLALPTLVMRWRQTSEKFRGLIVVNGIVVLILLNDAITTIRN